VGVGREGAGTYSQVHLVLVTKILKLEDRHFTFSGVDNGCHDAFEQINFPVRKRNAREVSRHGAMSESGARSEAARV
jgi:hypothetical protein